MKIVQMKKILYFCLCALLMHSASLPASAKSQRISSASDERVRYVAPGIGRWQEDLWTGGENLGRLPSSMGLFIDFIMPEGVQFPIAPEQLQLDLEELLLKGGVSIIGAEGGTPLPFLHLFALIYPIKGGFIIASHLRLIDEVERKNFPVPPEFSWQGILWERQRLAVVNEEESADKFMSTMYLQFGQFIQKYQAHLSAEGSQKALQAI